MTVVGTIFLISWYWKNREEIYNKKERIDQFVTLGVVGMGGVAMTGIFGFAFLGLTFNALIGNITGLEQIPDIFHIPLIVVVIGLCALFSWLGLALMYHVAKELKKAIVDPTYKI